jgi:HEAT repeat protein
VVKGLDNLNGDVRSHSAGSMGRIGDPKALHLLKKSLKDVKKSVRLYMH